MLKTAALVAISAVALYQVGIAVYIFTTLSIHSQGEFGSIIAVVNDLRFQYPVHFEMVNRVTKLPFPNNSAKRYYEEQKDFFLKAAEEFEIHPYWADNNAKEGMGFREVVTERVLGMYRQFQATGRMDYRLEKDRCAMIEFFRNNNIPHPAVKKMWYSKEAVIEDLKSGAIEKMVDNFPIFLKACHLTQQSSDGTFSIKTPAALKDNEENILKFINHRWDYRSRDVDRPWQDKGDKLTDALTPSYEIQEPFMQTGGNQMHVEGRVAVGLIEVRAEVMWGKVYLVNLDATTIFRRDGKIEDYTSFMGGVLHMPPEAGKRVSWLRDEGYIDCVIEVSERLAQAAHIEYVRVDVFIDKGDPKNCAVNEISLTSGYVYYGHEERMVNLWIDGLVNKRYKVFETDIPVHELKSV
mmetsp:Transcript_21917/g.31738  ORF Transcript_21917/g.31738 Transcript_21917/m.31738 type:complete len:409 (+) Transcript_21917:85-1311(+)